ncbi:MAG TPA: glycosyltransferase family 39 protein [Solirubrobacteraceae bacterium]
MSSRFWSRGFPAVLALAAVTRIALIAVTPHIALFGDPADYQRWGASLATGHGFPMTEIASPGTPSAFRPPAYPLALAGLYAVVGVHVLAGRALGAILGVATAGLLAVLGRALWGPRVGLIAGGICAVYPPLVALSGTLVSEALFIPLELGLALALVKVARRPGHAGWAAVAGLLCAATVLTRAVAEVWVFVAVGVALFAGAGSVPLRTRAVAATAALAAIVIGLAPWTARNLETFHTLVPITTDGGFVLAGQYNSTVAASGPLQSVWQIPLIIPDVAARVRPLYERPGGVNEAQLDAALRSIALHYVAAHPAYLPTAVANDTLRLLDLGPGHTLQTAIVNRQLAIPPALRLPDSLSAQILAALALLGLIIAVTKRPLGAPWLWILPATAWLVTVPALGTPLKRAPMDPFLILLAALAIDTAVNFRRAASTERAPAAKVPEPAQTAYP